MFHAVRKSDKKKAYITLFSNISPGYADIAKAEAAKLLGISQAECTDADGMPCGCNLAPLDAIYHAAGELAMVYQDIPQGTLFAAAVATREPEDTYSEMSVVTPLSKVLTALSHLHSAGIVHGNLQISDLVIPDLQSARELECLVANYGVPGLKPAAATGILAPECLQGGTPTKATDVWGLGVVLYFMLVGYPPFPMSPAAERADAEGNPEKTAQLDAHDAQMKEKATKGEVPYAAMYWKAVSEDAKELVGMMLVADPLKRCTLKQVEDHPFMTSPVALNDDMPEAREKFKELVALQ